MELTEGFVLSTRLSPCRGLQALAFVGRPEREKALMEMHEEARSEALLIMINAMPGRHDDKRVLESLNVTERREVVERKALGFVSPPVREAALAAMADTDRLDAMVVVLNVMPPEDGVEFVGSMKLQDRQAVLGRLSPTEAQAYEAMMVCAGAGAPVRACQIANDCHDLTLGDVT